MGSEKRQKNIKQHYIGQRQQLQMSTVLTFLLFSTSDRPDNWVEKKEEGKNTGVEDIAGRRRLLSALTPSAFTMSTVVVTGLSLMMAPLFATTAFVRTLLSVSFPLPVSAVSFPALLLFVLPVSAPTPARPFGLPLLSVPLPVVFMPPVVRLPPALFIL